MTVDINELIKMAYKKSDPSLLTMDYHYHDDFEVFRIWSGGEYVLVKNKVILYVAAIYMS